MMKRSLLAAVVLGLAALTAPAADAVTLKIRKPQKGDVTKETKDETSDTVVNITVNGQSQKQDVTDKAVAVFTDEILETGGAKKKPTKTKRTYEKCEATIQGKELAPKLAGMTVLIEKVDGKFQYSIDGKPVSGDAETLLKREFDKEEKDMPEIEEVLLPAKAVKAGDKWEVKADLMAKVFGEQFGIDADKAKGTGTLTKVYEKGGKTFGVMSFKLDLPVTEMKSAMGNAPATDGSVLTMTVDMDMCVDGTAQAGTATVGIKMKVGVVAGGADVKIRVDGKVTGKLEPVTKK